MEILYGLLIFFVPLLVVYELLRITRRKLREAVQSQYDREAMESATRWIFITLFILLATIVLWGESVMSLL